MDNIKDDSYFVTKIKEDLAFILKHMENVDSEELRQNEILQDSMLFRLIQISENAKKISQKFKDKRPDIPWTALYGLRNRIVHDYGSVDLEIVYTTLKDDLPELLKMM